MIVPKMSAEEMRKEFMHDQKVVNAKIDNTWPRLLFDLQKRKQTHAVETIIYETASRNRWMLLFCLDGENSYCVSVCLTLDHGGFLRVLSGMQHEKVDYIAEYNIHFLKRYNERMKLGLTKPEQIVKHYFKNNRGQAAPVELGQLEEEKTFEMFVPVNGGVSFGLKHDDTLILEMKTFVSDEMLGQSQMETKEYLKNYRESDHPPAPPLM